MKHFTLILLLPIIVFARQTTYEHLKKTDNPPYVPWFTGSLLPPSAINAAPGHPVIAPFVGFSVTYGEYQDNWNIKGTTNTYSVNPYLEILFGINDHIGIDIYTSCITNFKKDQSSTHLQDTIILLGFQIARDKPKTWIPDIRIILQETFPTGNYQKLNPKKLGTDSTGLGAFQTGFNLVAQKLFPIRDHFLLLKWTFAYLFPASVHVKGLNAYGGDISTSGTGYPGQSLYFYLSGEYSLNQQWVLALDSLFEYQKKSTFSGHTIDHVGTPPMLQFSVAPQLEYNFSNHSGLLFTLWTTLFGRNSPAFASFIATYYYAF